LAPYPGVIQTDGDEAFVAKVGGEGGLVDEIVRALATPPEVQAPADSSPALDEIVFTGTFDEVQDYFEEQLWSDGLPVVPPTLERVEAFLACTDRAPDALLGVLPPENRAATVWNTAVNGVMAGCRPEYMPVLIAAVEAIADPEFRLKDAGSTPGWEPLIVLSGPIVKELNFNYGAGVMRVGRRANTSIGRFLRLYMRNIAGLRIPPGTTDKGCIGYSFNVVMPENEDAAAELGWPTFGSERGLREGESGVTVQSVVAISPPTYSRGDSATDHLEILADVIGQRTCGYWSCWGVWKGRWHPLLLLSPSVAGVLSRAGLTKDDIRNYFYDNVKIPARLMERYGGTSGGLANRWELKTGVEGGWIPAEYYESDDPERLVRVFPKAEWINIIVSGDPSRNQSRGYVNNHQHGPPVTRRIDVRK
jgi:hypothetical protein